MNTITDAAETWGSAHAAMLGAFQGQKLRDAGHAVESLGVSPLSGEWAGDLTPMMLAYEVLGLDYDLDEMLEDEDAREAVLGALADAYEDAFWAVIAGEATGCRPLVGTVNPVCETPGTYCDHDIIARTTKED